FFFQAEDGIRDFHVTGVQTCALPISSCSRGREPRSALLRVGSTPSKNSLRKSALRGASRRPYAWTSPIVNPSNRAWSGLRKRSRSEERRVGKGGRARLWVSH